MSEIDSQNGAPPAFYTRQITRLSNIRNTAMSNAEQMSQNN